MPNIYLEKVAFLAGLQAFGRQAWRVARAVTPGGRAANAATRPLSTSPASLVSRAGNAVRPGFTSATKPQEFSAPLVEGVVNKKITRGPNKGMPTSVRRLPKPAPSSVPVEKGPGYTSHPVPEPSAPAQTGVEQSISSAWDTVKKHKWKIAGVGAMGAGGYVGARAAFNQNPNYGGGYPG